MKKIIFGVALAAGVSLTSCSDFLDQKSPSESTPSSVYSSEYYTSIRVNQLYADLMEDRTYSQDLAFTYGMNSDIELVDGLGTNATASSERGFMNYNSSPSWTRLDDLWTKMFAIIEDANDIVGGIEQYGNAKGTSNDVMSRYLGEALTVRAMAYFDLVRIFGDIPMKFEATKADLSNVYLPKTDRDIILDSLMNHLDRAIELLPWADEQGYTTEHTTKGYAHGLLAQIALTRAGYVIREQAKEGYETAEYTDAVYPTQRPAAAERQALYERALKHLTAVINSGKHSLNPSFENEWYLINQLTLDQTFHENLFEIPTGLNHNGELGYTVGVRLNGLTSKYGYSNSSGKMKLTAPFLYSFQEGDTRRDITVAPMQIQEVNGVTTETMLGNAPFALYVGKWDVRKMSDEWLAQNLKATAKHTTGINPVKMRYANVLLWYAEVMNELAGPNGSVAGDAGLTAVQALKTVHSRAFESADKANAEAWVDAQAGDKETFFNALVDENAWEFAGESFRKYDLIRWNLLAAKILEMKETYKTQLEDGTYQAKIYYNYLDEAKTQLDMSSVTWNGIPNGKSEADYAGNTSSFGASKAEASDTQYGVNLPAISGGLVGDNVAVKNRYLMPIGNSTISASNGYMKNSYGW